MWDEITDPVQNFSGVGVEVWEWIMNAIATLYNEWITYPWWS